MFVAVMAIAPDQVQQLLARIDAAGILRELHQQVEFPGGQFDRLATDRNGALFRIDRHGPGGYLRLASAIGFRTQRLQPAEDRLYPRDQLSDAEGLGQVIVGAHLQPDHAVDLGRFGGQHQDRCVMVAGAQAAAEFQPLHARQHQIEDDQVPAAGRSEFVAAVSVGGQLHLAIQVAQMQRDQLGDILVIFDDQYSS